MTIISQIYWILLYIHFTHRLSIWAFYSPHGYTHHRQSIQRLNQIVYMDSIHEQNRTTIISSRPLEDITTTNLYKLYKSEFKNPSCSSLIRQYIKVEGYIVKYRSYGSSLAFLDVIQSDVKNETAEILMKRDSYGIILNYDEDNITPEDLGQSAFSALIKSLRPGMKIQMVGAPSTTYNPGEVVFLAQNIKIIRLPRDPQLVKGILQRVQLDRELLVLKEGKDMIEGLHLDEIAKCIPMNGDTLRGVLSGEPKVDSASMTNTTMSIQEKSIRFRMVYASAAAEICAQLEPDYEYPEIFLKKLHSKKSKRGTIQLLDKNDAISQIQSQNYRDTLPIAPLEYIQTPSVILSRIHRQETLEESTSIQELLESSNGENRNDDNSIRYVGTSGWVLNRKQYRDSICILWITDDPSSEPHDTESSQSFRIKCVLDRNVLERSYGIRHGIKSETSPFDIYSYIASPGARIDIWGYYVNNFKSETVPVLWVGDILLRRSSWSPQSINFLLTHISRSVSHKNTFDNAIYPLSLEEITSAFELPGGETEAKQLIQFCSENDLTARQWRAAEISKRLQEVNKRTKLMKAEMIQLLDSFENLRQLWPIEHVMLTHRSDDISSSYTKTSCAGSRWERVKRPQLAWMTREILNLVKNHPDFERRPLHIVDIGGGRGHLANYISSVLGNSTAIVHVIDIDSRAVKNGMMRSKRNMLKVQYAVGDASDSEFLAETWGGNCPHVDIVVALHACGTLSDVALAFASSHSASFVIVPCCFRSNSHLSVNIQQGYSEIKSVSPAIWLGISSENLKLLNLIAEIQGDTVQASKGVHTICSLRANAVKKYRMDFNIMIKTFPVAFSTRNFCIVGSPLWR